jgi:hypothetical protein
MRALAAPLQSLLGSGSRRQALRRVGALALAGLALTELAATPATAATTPDTAAAPHGNPTLPAELSSTLPGAQALGAAKLRFLGLDIYAARLWVASGFQPDGFAQSPLALELNYFRSLSGQRIAERSLQEMRRQAQLNATQERAWLDAMLLAFPDVKSGDRITGLHTPGVGARFWFNGQERPAVRDAEFSRLFFGIWLSDASSEPHMRASLLGHSAP